MSDESPQGGYKLLLVPAAEIAEPRPGDDPAAAWVLDGIRNLTSNGPFEVMADVGPDRKIRSGRGGAIVTAEDIDRWTRRLSHITADVRIRRIVQEMRETAGLPPAGQ